MLTQKPLQPPTVQPDDLRIALFSGNYNYVRDGANQALNRLVGYLLRQGAKVRIYSPTTDPPAFEPTGDLVSVPSVAIPRRPEYRLALGLNARVRRGPEAFNPQVLHIPAPPILGPPAGTRARRHPNPPGASVPTPL